MLTQNPHFSTKLKSLKTQYPPHQTMLILIRHLSSFPKLPKLSKIPSRHRPLAIKEAQKSLTEYLHATRYLPFTFAEQISKNSIFSLSDVISKVDFSLPTFSRSFQRFLRYHPINEFEFLYESFGIEYDDVERYLPVNKFFLSEDMSVFDAACALSGFGFPWNKLGKMYEEESSIFGRDPCELNKMLVGFKECGLGSVSVIGICLTFPCVLSGGSDGLFDDLRRVFVDFDLGSCVEGNVDAWYEVCRKIRVFYDLGCEKGKMGELMGRSNRIFVEYTEEVLIRKLKFFCDLGVSKEEVGVLILSRPEILNIDLDSRLISVMGFLKHFGLEEEELKSVTQKHPYVFGRNRLANVPHVMRSLDLNEWFFDKMKNGDHNLLNSYFIGNPDDELDNDFMDYLAKIRSTRTAVHTLSKLDFVHGIGFGENKLTVYVLTCLHGTSSELQDRFDCLLRIGIGFSKLCKMLSLSPKILNQQPESLEQKVNFLCQDLGSSLDYLDVFPAYLCYDLEKRTKPRYKFHMWLTEKGLCTKEYSLSSIIATSEKQFVARIYGIHPAAPKRWLESFLKKDHCSSCQETSVL